MGSKEIDKNLLLQAIGVLNDGFIITDNTQPHNPIIFVNPAFETLSGYNAKEILGKSYRFLQQQESKKDHDPLTPLKQSVNEGKSCQIDLKNHRKDGRQFWHNLTLTPIHDENGKVTHFIGIQKDITDRKNLEEDLRKQAMEDPLTGLLNRRAFFMLAKKYIALAKRKNQTISIIVIDINNFKSVNDKLGHLIGDKALKSFSEILLATQRQSDIIARFGGDEFLVLLPTNQPSKVNAYLKRLNNNLKTFNKTDSLPFPLSISAGYAEYDPKKENALKKAIEEADKQMYENKRSQKTART